MLMSRINLCAVVFVFASVTVFAETEVKFAVSKNATDVLESRCLDCHDADTQKGEVRLDDLAGMALQPRLDLLNG